MTGIGILVALLAGVVSFASPCCLPMVPVYVTYMVGTTEPDDPRRRQVALRQSLAFVFGFTVVFVLLWASVGLVGYFVRDYVDVLRVMGGSALIVMGLHVAGLINIPGLNREARMPVTVAVGAKTSAGTVDTKTAPGYVRSSLLGVVFAAGWTPCVGPILGGIIGLASVSASALAGTTLLIAYALGLGIPFILVAIGAGEMSGRLSWFRKHHSGVALATGIMLVLVGFAMVTDLMVKLSSFMPNVGL